MASYRNLFRVLSSAFAFAALALFTSCGTSYNNATTNPGATSKFKHRIYLTNAYAGTTIILNADNDQVYGRSIATISGNDLLAESHNGAFTLQFSSGPDILYYIDNTIEDVSGSPISLTGDIATLGILSDNATAVTASRDAPVSGQPNGAVFILDLTNRVISSTISVPLAHYVALNHAGTKVLAFADNSNTAYVIDTSAKTATPIADPNGVLDRPVTAVFSADDSKAYIINCGAECGGTQAKVTMFDPSTNALGNSVDVDGATEGILDSSGTLYVAGSTNGNGTLQAIDTAALAAGNATPSTSLSISNGYHSTMAFADNNRLYIGSTNCSNAVVGGVVQGCLTMYDTSSKSAKITTKAGDVTGMQPIIGRSLVYVCENGELVIYDTSADAPRSNQYDVVGRTGAVLQIS
ncbi:MAG: YncE family protein [Terriglobales bacterium]